MSLTLAAASVLALNVAAASAQEQAAAPAPAEAAPQAPQPLAESIAAIVNDDLVSTYDLMQRMRLLMVTSGVQPTQETLPQLQAEAMRSLVDERLQIQELRRIEKQNKTEIIATDKEVDQEIADVARGNNISSEQLLASLSAQGVGAQTFREQLRAEQSWQNYISGRYGSRLRIGEDQISAFQQRLAEATSKPQYQVGEVFLDAARVGGMDVAMNGAAQLVAQMQQGAPFPAVARQFSAAATAANGGDAGWVSAGEMPPEVDAALATLRPGQLSAPIPVKDGVYIIFLRNKRSGADSLMVDLKQAAVTLPADAPESEVAAANAKLNELRGQVNSCSALEPAAAAMDGVIAGDLGEAEIKDLAPAFQEAARTLQVGQLSAPIRTDAGLHIVAVCGKKQGGQNAPSHDQIENRLRGQQLSLISKRTLRDLRNSATIETR
ncbi:peptidylprolyl isomerase [Caulobacter segnis]|uniref:peptidylprolyl isomerase n=1 Tax=Caulobacter segnis TaxID=88688 RepID=UPI00240FC395|nr:peptidylprolyl isomerase [Caulobacter segnis]MDG2522353.1 peptidylprolyl isomerase [Caulobacter segnis]